MSNTINISLDEEAYEIAKRIKIEKGYGKVSEICQNALKDFDSMDLTPSKIKTEILHIDKQLIDLSSRKQFLNEAQTRFEGQKEEIEIEQMSEKIVHETQSNSEIQEKTIKRCLMFEETINKGWSVSKEQAKELAEEFVLLWNNCERLKQPIVNLAEFMQSKEIKRKHG